jgi:D-3-phosphoglycerate dehydrogenase
MSARVLITDVPWESTEIEARVLAAANAELVLAGEGTEAELLSLVIDADAILTCFAQVSPAVVRAGRRLKVIGRYGIGVDNIAVDVATELGIPVANVPAYCVDEVAEHVIALLFALVRGVHQYDRSIRAGEWSLSVGLPIRRVRGQTLGILGLGRIGHEVARRAEALGLRVLVNHPRNQTRVRADGFEAVSLDELAARSDVISIHVPLNEDTRGMIDASFIAAMKPTAYLINTARGAIVDQDALAEALRAGKIQGAGLDVFEPERLSPGHPLLQSDRVLATPHTAFYSEESVRDLARLASENVAAILEGRAPETVVNPAVLKLDRWAHLSLPDHHV